jgi:hypothetical protein
VTIRPGACFAPVTGVLCCAATSGPDLQVLRARSRPAIATVVEKTPSAPGRQRRWPLMIGALGVVYGDIGTSPLYAIRESFHGPFGMVPSESNVLGVVSLIFWSLIVVICLKYLSFILRADNRGEGGILSLMALATRNWPGGAGSRRLLVLAGIFGATLFLCDGLITPSITVLSAVEGLHVATSVFDPYVIPIALVILIVLFSFQRFGTARVGGLFGPIMVVWFLTLAVLGVANLIVPSVHTMPCSSSPSTNYAASSCSAQCSWLSPAARRYMRISVISARRRSDGPGSDWLCRR